MMEEVMTMMREQRTISPDDLPDDLEELEAIRIDLYAKITQIQLQLGDRLRRSDAIRENRLHEYLAWRNRSNYALTKTQEEYQIVKAKLQRLKTLPSGPKLESEDFETCDPHDPHDMLYFMYSLVSRIIRSGKYTPTDGERVAISHTNNWLERNGFFL